MSEKAFSMKFIDIKAMSVRYIPKFMTINAEWLRMKGNQVDDN